jgi:hypothetical protein
MGGGQGTGPGPWPRPWSRRWWGTGPRRSGLTHGAFDNRRRQRQGRHW